MLRAAIASESALGSEVEAVVASGALVNDELMIALVKERLAQEDCVQNGWLLDGFPRSEGQAKAMIESDIVPDAVLVLDVDQRLLLERVEGRRTDPVTGASYHLTFNPPPEDAEVRARLVQRPDDTAEKLLVRINQFNDNVKGFSSVFEADSNSSKMFSIDGNTNPDGVFASIEKKLSEFM